MGSRKAGVTIRQEDLDSAIRNATATAGVVGGLVGVALGAAAGHSLHWESNASAALTGMVIGAATGAWAGRRIAIWSRGKAAKLILDGNREVLRDIGKQSGKFLELLEGGATVLDRGDFFAGLRPGPTQRGGQDRLATAFRFYLAAFDESDQGVKRERLIAANCEIVYHEHIRLEPYIRGSMPFIVRRCATERLMTYDIGEKVLAVGENLPGISTPTAAKNWTKIEDRMRYVFALFREFHRDPEVFSAPYTRKES